MDAVTRFISTMVSSSRKKNKKKRKRHNGSPASSASVSPRASSRTTHVRLRRNDEDDGDHAAGKAKALPEATNRKRARKELSVDSERVLTKQHELSQNKNLNPFLVGSIHHHHDGHGARETNEEDAQSKLLDLLLTFQEERRNPGSSTATATTPTTSLILDTDRMKSAVEALLLSITSSLSKSPSEESMTQRRSGSLVSSIDVIQLLLPWSKQALVYLSQNNRGARLDFSNNNSNKKDTLMRVEASRFYWKVLQCCLEVAVVETTSTTSASSWLDALSSDVLSVSVLNKLVPFALECSCIEAKIFREHPEADCRKETSIDISSDGDEGSREEAPIIDSSTSSVEVCYQHFLQRYYTPKQGQEAMIESLLRGLVQCVSPSSSLLENNIALGMRLPEQLSSRSVSILRMIKCTFEWIHRIMTTTFRNPKQVFQLLTTGSSSNSNGGTGITAKDPSSSPSILLYLAHLYDHVQLNVSPTTILNDLEQSKHSSQYVELPVGSSDEQDLADEASSVLRNDILVLFRTIIGQGLFSPTHHLDAFRSLPLSVDGDSPLLLDDTSKVMEISQKNSQAVGGEDSLQDDLSSGPTAPAKRRKKSKKDNINPAAGDPSKADTTSEFPSSSRQRQSYQAVLFRVIRQCSRVGGDANDATQEHRGRMAFIQFLPFLLECFLDQTQVWEASRTNHRGSVGGGFGGTTATATVATAQFQFRMCAQFVHVLLGQEEKVSDEGRKSSQTSRLAFSEEKMFLHGGDEDMVDAERDDGIVSKTSLTTTSKLDVAIEQALFQTLRQVEEYRVYMPAYDNADPSKAQFHYLQGLTNRLLSRLSSIEAQSRDSIATRNQKRHRLFQIQSLEMILKLNHHFLHDQLPILLNVLVASVEICNPSTEATNALIETDRPTNGNGTTHGTSRRNCRSQKDDKTDVEDGAIILVYPFAGDRSAMEQCASGFLEAKESLMIPSDETFSRLKQSPKKKRQARITIRAEDRKRLDGRTYLNDTLIDFWFQWIVRPTPNEAADSSTGLVYVLSTHFYSTLAREGPKAVERWTAKNSIDLFSKQFILIPIHRPEIHHWSLCVVVNPGKILETILLMTNGSTQEKGATLTGINQSENDNDDKPVACILFMDSLNLNDDSIKSTVASKIRHWLNHEWQRTHMTEKVKELGSPTTSQSQELAPYQKKFMKVIKPRVPLQKNAHDCGVFVCRFAYALLKNPPTISWQAIKNLKKSEKIQEFYPISRKDEFQFGMKEIVCLRRQMGMLIDGFSGLYHRWKQESSRDDEASPDDRTLVSTVTGRMITWNVPSELESIFCSLIHNYQQLRQLDHLFSVFVDFVEMKTSLRNTNTDATYRGDRLLFLFKQSKIQQILADGLGMSPRGQVESIFALLIKALEHQSSILLKDLKEKHGARYMEEWERMSMLLILTVPLLQHVPVTDVPTANLFHKYSLSCRDVISSLQVGRLLNDEKYASASASLIMYLAWCVDFQLRCRFWLVDNDEGEELAHASDLIEDSLLRSAIDRIGKNGICLLGHDKSELLEGCQLLASNRIHELGIQLRERGRDSLVYGHIEDDGDDDLLDSTTKNSEELKMKELIHVVLIVSTRLRAMGEFTNIHLLWTRFLSLLNAYMVDLDEETVNAFFEILTSPNQLDRQAVDSMLEDVSFWEMTNVVERIIHYVLKNWTRITIDDENGNPSLALAISRMPWSLKSYEGLVSRLMSAEDALAAIAQSEKRSAVLKSRQVLRRIGQRLMVNLVGYDGLVTEERQRLQEYLDRLILNIQDDNVECPTELRQVTSDALLQYFGSHILLDPTSSQSIDSKVSNALQSNPIPRLLPLASFSESLQDIIVPNDLTDSWFDLYAVSSTFDSLEVDKSREVARRINHILLNEGADWQRRSHILLVSTLVSCDSSLCQRECIAKLIQCRSLSAVIGSDDERCMLLQAILANYLSSCKSMEDVQFLVNVLVEVRNQDAVWGCFCFKACLGSAGNFEALALDDDSVTQKAERLSQVAREFFEDASELLEYKMDPLVAADMLKGSRLLSLNQLQIAVEFLVELTLHKNIFRFREVDLATLLAQCHGIVMDCIESSMRNSVSNRLEFNADPEDGQDSLKVYHLVYELVCTLLQRFPKQLYACSPCLFLTLHAMFEYVFFNKDDHCRQKGAQCLSRLCEFLVPHKDAFKKQVVGILVLILNRLSSKSTEYTVAQKTALMSAIYSLLDCCNPEYELAQLNVLLSTTASKTLFQSIYATYQKLHQYKGQY